MNKRLLTLIAVIIILALAAPQAAGDRSEFELGTGLNWKNQTSLTLRPVAAMERQDPIIQIHYEAIKAQLGYEVVEVLSIPTCCAHLHPASLQRLIRGGVNYIYRVRAEDGSERIIRIYAYSSIYSESRSKSYGNGNVSPHSSSEVLAIMRQVRERLFLQAPQPSEGLVPILDVGELRLPEESLPYLVMPYVRGEILDALSADGFFSHRPFMALLVIQGVLEAVSEVHKKLLFLSVELKTDNFKVDLSDPSHPVRYIDYTDDVKFLDDETYLSHYVTLDIGGLKGIARMLLLNSGVVEEQRLYVLSLIDGLREALLTRDPNGIERAYGRIISELSDLRETYSPSEVVTGAVPGADWNLSLNQI